MESLKANAANRKTKLKVTTGELYNTPGNSAKLTVPVTPYIREIPNKRMPEENADERIIFRAASEDNFFSRSKFDSAAIGIVASSSERKNMSRLPDDTRKNIPSKAESMRMKNSGKCRLLSSQSANNNDIR